MVAEVNTAHRPADGLDCVLLRSRRGTINLFDHHHNFVDNMLVSRIFIYVELLDLTDVCGAEACSFQRHVITKVYPRWECATCPFSMPESLCDTIRMPTRHPAWCQIESCFHLAAP